MLCRLALEQLTSCHDYCSRRTCHVQNVATSSHTKKPSGASFSSTCFSNAMKVLTPFRQGLLASTRESLSVCPGIAINRSSLLYLKGSLQRTWISSTDCTCTGGKQSSATQKKRAVAARTSKDFAEVKHCLHTSAVPADLRFDLFLLWKSSNASWDSLDLPQSPPPHEPWARCSMQTTRRIRIRLFRETLCDRRIQTSWLSLGDYRVCAATAVANQKELVCILYLFRYACRDITVFASVYAKSASSQCFSSACGDRTDREKPSRQKPAMLHPGTM